jgi:hypothetical protein
MPDTAANYEGFTEQSLQLVQSHAQSLPLATLQSLQLSHAHAQPPWRHIPAFKLINANSTESMK